jgi:tetratricopeptide (TPR) repeat protein
MSIRTTLSRPLSAKPALRAPIAGTAQRSARRRSSPRRPGLTALPHPAAKLSQAEISPSDRVLILRQQALLRAQQGHDAEAIALFSQLIADDATNASLYNNRGLLYFQQKQWFQALQDYNCALELNPELAKVYNNRANCYVALGNLEAAIADYEAAIDFDPTNIRAWINQGITYRDLGTYGQAIENFDLALQILQMMQATDSEATLEGHLYAERGRTYHQLGDWNLTVADYHRALAALPSRDTRSVSQRLRLQVEGWLSTLLNPLSA